MEKINEAREFLQKNYLEGFNERDELIKLGIEKNMTILEIQNLLTLSEKSNLYARFKRDAIIIHGISNAKSVAELNDELIKCGETKL